jgi:hypothetical protein
LLEQLETRDCPAAPVITSLSATVLANKMVTLSGTVTDSNPASVTLSFSGVMSGNAQANASGNFSYTAQASSLGTASAVATDGGNQMSSSVSVTVSTAAPVVSLSVSYGSQRTVTLTGTVTSVNAGGRTIIFSGKVTGTVTTNADGTFSYTATASGLGTVQGSTIDLWGQNSNTPTVTLTSNAPSIAGFTATHGTNGWTFTGTVNDESPAGLTITFGGIPDMVGKTTTIQSNGTFSFTIDLGTDYGTVTAQTADWWGLRSNIAQYAIF